MLGSGQRTLGTQVFDDLFSKITTRQWREGEKLPSETDLARHYNVSRPVIRAAIQELRAQGFVTTTKGLGTFVKRCNYDQVSSIRLSQINDLEDMVRCYEYRIALEVYIPIQYHGQYLGKVMPKTREMIINIITS